MTRARPAVLFSSVAQLVFLAGVPAYAGPGKPHATRPVASGDAVECTARAILGEQKPGGIDKRLKLLEHELSKPPFSAYKSLRLMETKQLSISQGSVGKTTLPTKKVLKLRFKEKLLVKGKVRLRMHLSITPPKAKEFLPGTLFSITDGGTLLVAGDNYRGGTLIVGITCRSK